MKWESEVYEMADAWSWIETAFQKGWTDGIAVCPPTVERVQAMIEHMGRPPDEVVGVVPPRMGIATLEKIAVNCVMAGCLPEYLPVVLAALGAMLDTRVTLEGVEATTHPCEPLTIVSGPVVKELAFNCGDGVFGGGSRANATIGRALRLILWNIGGAIPGESAKAPFSHPGRYVYCIAENNEHSPWNPIHADLGLDAGISAVTVFPCEAPHNVTTYRCDSLQTLVHLADTMSVMGSNNMWDTGETLVVLLPKVAQMLDKDGWTKSMVKQYLYEHARRRIADLARGRFRYEQGEPDWPKWVNQKDPDSLVPVAGRPEDIHIAVTGGTSSHWYCMWCPGWGQHNSVGERRANAVARPIVKPLQARPST